MMFENLKGIEKGREEKEKQNMSSLEILLELSDKVIGDKAYLELTNAYSNSGTEKLKMLCPTMWENLQDKLKDVEYNEDDLKNFIMARANIYNSFDPEQKILGAYAGFLLQLLTHRNKEKGERTTFYIDGKKNKFDYLFCSAQDIDELIVDNFRGTGICSYIINEESKANMIACMNITGGYTLFKAGTNGGKINLLVCKNIKGERTMCHAVYQSHVNAITAINIDGYAALDNVGGGNSHIGAVVGDNIKGGREFFGMDDKRYIGMILKKDCGKIKVRLSGKEMEMYRLARKNSRIIKYSYKMKSLIERAETYEEESTEKIVETLSKKFSAEPHLKTKIVNERKKIVREIFSITEKMKNAEWEDTIKYAKQIHPKYLEIKGLLAI